MEEKNALIYGVKSKDKFHYIGKTNKRVDVNGTISKSKIRVQYFNPPLRDIFQNYENVSVEPIILVPDTEWYPEKLREIVDHADNPLINAKWMIEGKRGYWQDKKRDAHTLLMLSESKYKQFVQYDKRGNLKNFWKSGKEAGIKVFGDYEVKNGSGSTKLYQIVQNHSLKGRFAIDSYWFGLEELIVHFNGIPQKLNLLNMMKTESENRKKRRRVANVTDIKRYCVERYERNNDELVAIYTNAEEAAYKLKLGIKTVRCLCTNKTKPAKDFILKYGEKILQPKKINYPPYQTQLLKRL